MAEYICQNCKAEMAPNAVLCIHCGLDLRTGQTIAVRQTPAAPSESAANGWLAVAMSKCAESGIWRSRLAPSPAFRVRAALLVVCLLGLISGSYYCFFTSPGELWHSHLLWWLAGTGIAAAVLVYLMAGSSFSNFVPLDVPILGAGWLLMLPLWISASRLFLEPDDVKSKYVAPVQELMLPNLEEQTSPQIADFAGRWETANPVLKRKKTRPNPHINYGSGSPKYKVNPRLTLVLILNARGECQCIDHIPKEGGGGIVEIETQPKLAREQEGFAIATAERNWRVALSSDKQTLILKAKDDKKPATVHLNKLLE